MNLPDERLIFAYWLVVAVFILAAMGFFSLGSSSAKVKRQAFYWYLGIGGLLILGWFWMLAGPKSLLLFIPLYAVAVIVSIKTTQFCDSCGKTIANQFTRARFCPRCGADLTAQDEHSADL